MGSRSDRRCDRGRCCRSARGRSTARRRRGARVASRRRAWIGRRRGPRRTCRARGGCRGARRPRRRGRGGVRGVGVRREGNQGTRERRDGDRARGGFARGAPPGGRALGDSRDGTEGGAVVRGVADERARVRVARPRRGETGRENTRLGENDQWWSRRVGHRGDASRAGARPAARGVGNADDSQVVGGHHESVDSGNRSVLRANTTRDPLSLLLRAGLRWRESGARDDRRSTRFPPSSRLTSSPRAC